MLIGYVLRYKARGVVKGFLQREGIDYVETFSPVVKIQSLRTLIAVALMYNLDIHAMDISTAFLYAEIDDEQIYIEAFPGTEGFDESNGKIKIHRLKKSLYGLHQSPRLWYETIVDIEVVK